MEKQPNQSDRDPDNRGEKTPNRISTFLRSWRERRERPVEVSGEKTDDKDDKDSEKKEKSDDRSDKKSRWQSVLDGLKTIFHNEVEKPEPIKPLAVDKTPPEALEPVVPVETEPVTATDRTETTAREPAAERLPDTPERPTEPEPRPAERRVRPPRPEPTPAAVMAAERFVAPFRGVEATTPASRSIERVVETPRGTGALAALLGLEYIGRKRADHKIRKDVSRRLASQQKRGRVDHQRIENNVQTTRQELRDVEAQQRAFEVQLSANRPQQPERLPTPQAAGPETVTAQLETPKLTKPEIAPTKVDKLPMAEQVVRQVERLKPEAVLQRVESAAEQNIPVEAIYERRHEVKTQQDSEVGGGTGGPGQAQTPVLLTAVCNHVNSPILTAPLILLCSAKSMV